MHARQLLQNRKDLCAKVRGGGGGSGGGGGGGNGGGGGARGGRRCFVVTHFQLVVLLFPLGTLVCRRLLAECSRTWLCGCDVRCSCIKELCEMFEIIAQALDRIKRDDFAKRRNSCLSFVWLEMFGLWFEKNVFVFSPLEVPIHLSWCAECWSNGTAAWCGSDGKNLEQPFLVLMVT